ncbi:MULTISPECIES: TetR/AcrR family transcriptional regulator [Streptomyces]|uniref:TetR/AcrR family transcriptional regulator n=1 Tax=Streptomyces caniscabiei TaxID=2746961 RepID=A0ABU4MR15_9ACTN|nr:MULTISPECIES: TetR/AcrR family transcriptional regulator [Streptomyces]MBE4734126.1 TetR/AcrR family transcriptional regulator [Streptomyces caniscabiei]MBE4759266.1 TetR/AcrR family transcriptional regulator [Streptomyces caniscabiei]MBE4773331.1 TetR/AcrR family transcriptional regulator [Streptomyces caniscabiei]MBE4783718.1 TetR/AcrR family transcriptional regulator [Streptomyces caniscabiei]MBE4793022.1 TetR/AcrR family transcriptional regulator [Streptomyces caniscabiei]
MVTSRWTTAPAPTVSPRRRGAVLERAILDAALEQLSTVGWSGLTMEGVAAGAQTGKAAVYRRWPSKEDLVADALQAGLPRFEEAPDLGSVRDDLLALCRQAREAMFSRPGFALRSVIHECDTMQAERFHGVIIEGVVEPTVKLLREVVERGIRRGEVRPDAANGYVFDAIPAMMMYRSKMCGSEWNERDIEEMIDQLMVPLLRR